MRDERRVALVTGTSRGIGLACAQVLLEAGLRVYGIDRDPPDTPLQNWPDFRPLACDVADADALHSIIDEAARDGGRLDVLVNNAGVHPPSRLIDDVSVDAFLDLVRINLLSAFVGCQTALPHLRRQGGSIVNVASLVGLIGQEAAVDYCATKAALVGLTKALAIDEAVHGVRVNCVCPGAIRTPLAEALNTPAQLQTIGGWAWLERMGTATEVADVVAFLSSERASFVTGQEVVVAGGAELGYGVKGGEYFRAMSPDRRR